MQSAIVCFTLLSIVPAPSGSLAAFTAYHDILTHPLSGRSLNARLPNEAGTRMYWKGDTPSGGASINDLPVTKPKSPATSDNIAATNRSSHHDRSSTLSDVGQLGSKVTSSSYARDIKHAKTNCSSTELSLDGRSDDKVHPPDCGRPVRLPVDGPELQFAHVPIFFDLVPDVTTAPSPDRVGPAVGGVSPSTNDEEGAALDHTTDWQPDSPVNVSGATEAVEMELLILHMGTVLSGRR